jgi:hypothetical protein
MTLKNHSSAYALLRKNVTELPQDYSYSEQDFNAKFIAIWLVCKRKFDYNLGKPTQTIWGFVNKKTGEVHAPINPKTPGKVVTQTSPFSAMPIRQNALEKLLFS